MAAPWRDAALWKTERRLQSAAQRQLVKILTRDVTRCLDDTHIFQTSDSYKSPWNMCFYDLGMHCSFGRADALFVIAMQDQPLLRDLKMQFTNTARPRCGAAVTLLRWWAQMSLRANLRSIGSR